MTEIEPRPQSSLRNDDDFDDLEEQLERFIEQHGEKSIKGEPINVRMC